MPSHGLVQVATPLDVIEEQSQPTLLPLSDEHGKNPFSDISIEVLL